MWDYHIALSAYEVMERGYGKEYTRKEAKEYIQENEPLFSRILYYPKVKASETYLKNSSEETSKF